MAERAVGDDSHAVLLAPGDDRVLDRALFQMIEDLIAGQTTTADDFQDRFKVGHVKVADTSGEDLPLATEPLERRNRLRERVLATPVQKITIQPVGLEASERPLAGHDRSASRGILGKDLGDQENLIAAPGYRLGHHFLGGARSVHLRGIDMRHPQIKAETQSGDRACAVVTFPVPGSLTNGRDVVLGGTELTLFHMRSG